jgi:hypothetical protein
MAKEIEELGVLPGYRCNFSCAHCLIVPKLSDTLSGAEISVLAETLAQNKIGSIIIAGGEPTLHIPVINNLLRGIKNPEKIFITITTNGSFAKNVEVAEATLKRIEHLSKVQLSYDKWHAKFLPFENVGHLFLACSNIGVEFSVNMVIESPLDLLLVSKLRAVGDFSVVIQKVISAGAAESNAISYNFPAFEPEVLGRSCPNLKKPVYLSGRGFALCDLNLPAGSQAGKMGQKTFATLGELLESDFHKTMRQYTFGGLLDKFGIDRATLRPEHSLACNLCRHIGRCCSSGSLG